MKIELEITVKDAAAKFDHGSVEHATEGLLIDRLHDAEMYSELIDFFHYYQARQMKRKLKSLAPKTPKGKEPAKPTDEQVRDFSLGRMRKALKTINKKTGMLGDASMELTTVERLWVRLLQEV